MAARNFSERDLRGLSTDDLLSMIRQDIQELDQLISVRRHNRPAEPKAGKHKAVKAAAEAARADEEEPPEIISLHAVTCCNHHMGDFPAIARVRCPFCSQWHKAGDFPAVK
jgi:hypothetical protein